MGLCLSWDLHKYFLAFLVRKESTLELGNCRFPRSNKALAKPFSCKICLWYREYFGCISKGLLFPSPCQNNMKVFLRCIKICLPQDREPTYFSLSHSHASLHSGFSNFSELISYLSILSSLWFQRILVQVNWSKSWSSSFIYFSRVSGDSLPMTSVLWSKKSC